MRYEPHSTLLDWTFSYKTFKSVENEVENYCGALFSLICLSKWKDQSSVSMILACALKLDNKVFLETEDILKVYFDL